MTHPASPPLADLKPGSATSIDGTALLNQLDSAVQKLGTRRIKALLTRCGNPQNQVPTVHVAGTNGKGSVIAILNSVCSTAGYRVGATCSPHLQHPRERVMLNGQPIDSRLFAKAVQQQWAWLDVEVGPFKDEQGQSNETWPTYFEFLTLLAFRAFAGLVDGIEPVDIALIEVGLGGRLDATNVLESPLATVITQIGLDHQAILGDSLEAIATEKAGILTTNSAIVMGPNCHDEVRNVIQTMADERQAGPLLEVDSETLHLEQVHWPRSKRPIQQLRNVVSGETYQLGLMGTYQRNNLATALATLNVMSRSGFSVSPKALSKGLKAASWPARFQVLPDQHLVIDGSHNQDGLKSLVDTLTLAADTQSKQRWYWMVSLRNNRPMRLLWDAMEQAPYPPLGLIFTRPQENTHLFHEPMTLRREARLALLDCLDIPIWAAEAPKEALWLLQHWIGGHQGISSYQVRGLVTGSLYQAGEVLTLLESN